MNGRKIDVIVPVYNIKKYLDDFFSSLQKQSFNDFSIVIIDDMSIDESLQIIMKYKEYFNDRMIVLKNDRNMGLSATRNVGLDAICKEPAKYVTFLDPDDWIDDDYFEVLYNTAEKFQADLVIGGLQRFEDETGKIICTEMIHYSDELIDKPWEYDEFAYINPCVCAKLFLFQNIGKIRFRDIKRSEDTCFFFETLTAVKKVKFTNQAKYHYRIRNSSLSGALGKDKCDSMHKEFGKLLGEFKKENYRPFKEQFEAQVFIRSSCGGVCRLSFNDMKKAKTNEREEFEFLETVMPTWRKNKYLCIGMRRSSTFKQFMLKGCALLYKMHVFVIFIWIYFFSLQILKKDVRA